ncbi:hemerythrin domain-containing protein [Streptomyces sp. NPDC050448]|uniref:hemerythrin domain-containing protein n=1 Tax=Streptomyces sp. NPDC050448 TaxID=3155404 RepID=UPI00342E7620
MSTDAIVMLREDHKRVRKLIRACRAADGDQGTEGLAGDTSGQGEIVNELLHELTVHMFVEKEVMYPQVRRLMPETAPLVLEFQEEHHVADVLARELAGMQPGDESYAAKLHVLIDTVERHLAAEEQEWFPQVREALGRKELQSIGVQTAAVRERAPERPHPSALSKLAELTA